MERRELYEDDLTEERLPPPAQRDDAAHSLRMDPEADAPRTANLGVEDDDEDEDDEDEDLDEDE